MNKRLRPQVERSFAKQALLYLPDRILDLLDVFTVGAHLGLGFYGDHHVTRGLQLAWDGGICNLLGSGPVVGMAGGRRQLLHLLPAIVKARLDWREVIVDAPLG